MMGRSERDKSFKDTAMDTSQNPSVHHEKQTYKGIGEHEQGMKSLSVPISSSVVRCSGSFSAPISPVNPALNSPRASSVPMSTSSKDSNIQSYHSVNEAIPGFIRQPNPIHCNAPSLYPHDYLSSSSESSSGIYRSLIDPSSISLGTVTHIPNIVIDPVSARDSYGHSHTPPFVVPHLSARQLGVPSVGSGRKMRTNSDSALYEVEKQHVQNLQAQGMSPSVSSERLHLEHIRITDSPDVGETDSDSQYVDSSYLKQDMNTENIKEESSPAVRMDIGESDIKQEEALDLKSPLKAAETPARAPEKQMVPFIWKFQHDKISRSHSTRTYWIRRRHSDSNLPTEPQNLSISCDAQHRSHSTGESHEPRTPLTPLTPGSIGESFRSSLSESTESPDQPSFSENLVSAKRMKLKKKLLKRYQLQSEESSIQQSIESDDVFSPSPGVFPSRMFSFSPERIHGLQQTIESSQPISTQSSDGISPTSLHSRNNSPTISSAMDLSQSSLSKGGVGRPIRPLYVKTEGTVDSFSSEDVDIDQETEPSVFFSPSMFSPRLYSDSPRAPGFVFQFQSPERSRSPSLEKSESSSPQSSTVLPTVTKSSSCYYHVAGESPRSTHSSIGAKQVFQLPPSPLTHQEPLSPQRPPIRRSPSPLYQAPSPNTQYESRDDSKLSPTLRAGLSDPQNQNLPHVMPTICEHSQSANNQSSTMTYAAHRSSSSSQLPGAAFSSPQYSLHQLTGLPVYPTPLHSQEPTSSSSFSQVMQTKAVYSQNFQIDDKTSLAETMSTTIPLTFEHMLRHPSFTTTSVHFPGSESHHSPQTFSSTTVSLEQQQQEQGSLSSLCPITSTPITYTATTSLSDDMKTSTAIISIPSVVSSQHSFIIPSSQALSTPFQGYSGNTPKSGSSTCSYKRDKDAAKIIYCPFSEKVQEQRYQQDPHHQSFVCPVCGQMFPSFNYLANHMVNHLPSETITKGPGEGNKIHICKVCNKSFSRSDMLTRHMRLHTGLRPYECRLCGQVFSRSDHLNTHTRTHTGEKPYRCPQCPYAAPRRDMITRHMRIHIKQKRGRRNSSTGSADTHQSSFSSQESAESEHQKQLKNPSLSSVESSECPYIESSGSGYIPHTRYQQIGIVTSVDQATSDDSQHWAFTSGGSIDSLGPETPSTPGSTLPPTPSTPGTGYVCQWADFPKKRSWSATSIDSDFDKGKELIGIGSGSYSMEEYITLSSGKADEGSKHRESEYSTKSTYTHGTDSILVSSSGTVSEDLCTEQMNLKKSHSTSGSFPKSCNEQSQMTYEYSAKHRSEQELCLASSTKIHSSDKT